MNPTGQESEYFESLFKIPKMDCAAEEQMVRMALSGNEAIKGLSFDLTKRELSVWHGGQVDSITSLLKPLGLGAELIDSHGSAQPPPETAQVDDRAQARVLWILLAINAGMFLVEFIGGWLVESTGLLADSLDMFADATVYGISLFAVGRSARLKLGAARVNGMLQLLLALGALSEVVRRLLYGSEPLPDYMMVIAAVALIANVTCLRLIFKHRHGGAHMKASYICSTNDVIGNFGVILAGGLVALTSSRYPDLVIGAIIGVVVLVGAVRILRIR